MQNALGATISKASFWTKSINYSRQEGLLLAMGCPKRATKAPCSRARVVCVSELEEEQLEAEAQRQVQPEDGHQDRERLVAGRVSHLLVEVEHEEEAGHGGGQQHHDPLQPPDRDGAEGRHGEEDREGVPVEAPDVCQAEVGLEVHQKAPEREANDADVAVEEH